MFIFRDQGMTEQQAVDQIGEMIYGCYRRWQAAMDRLPSWEVGVDEDVMKFIYGCRNIALANLHWRYVSCLPMLAVHLH